MPTPSASDVPAIVLEPASQPDPVPADKAAWRALAGQVLRNRSPQARKVHAEVLQRVVLQLVEARGARLVGLYSPIGAETETREVANALLVRGIALAYPRVLPDGSQMVFARSTGPAALVPRPRSRTLEPAGPVVTPAELDLLVVPCLAVTPQLIRLGRGGGYFDRYLPQLPDSTWTLAVVDADCVWPWSPVEPHDRGLRWACTSRGLCGPAA
jgi:5-formyltetrahydrofolate cyclo-ligase